MNQGEIAEMFIRAAEIDRAMPGHVGPQAPRSVSLGYVHDWVDKLGWGTKRLEEERTDFFERLGIVPTSSELSQLEILRAWLMGVDDAKDRRALLAWARSKAGGRPFKKWCKDVEGIHPETGRRRKDRAVSRINAILSGKPLQHKDLQAEGVLAVDPETDYLEATFEELRAAKQRDPGRRNELAVMDAEQRDFSWAEKRNERRRQQEQAKRKRAEAA